MVAAFMPAFLSLWSWVNLGTKAGAGTVPNADGGALENPRQNVERHGPVCPPHIDRPLRKVDVRLPEHGRLNSHGARSVHLIITMIRWIRTSRSSMKNSGTGTCGGAS